ncbi:glycosyltransferase family 4 protein [Crenobacter cavernae]|uniref:Glycosyltransferase n=1 Tax=Crenobacter cavernae TaxID=2290923 RepID=A0ABY0FDI6_9NEIS|nr:glycosyltransferase family 4 protein [Crenobacter cavernae]RXZ43109.1 glycosyltransferase [Crenobacter cavernae]
MKIAHLSSAHPRHDIRIFIKECQSLAAAGHDVTLVVADGQGDETRGGVNIVDVGPKSGGRFSRMTGTVRRVKDRALSLKPDVAHFHDPELIPAALALKKAGIKVVYDVHEDLPRQVLAKPWIPALARPLVSRAVEVMERYAVRRFDAVVAATPLIRDRFKGLVPIAVDVCNYPILEELLNDTCWEDRQDVACYLGGITRIRGISPIVAALPEAGVRLKLAGPWSEGGLRDEMVKQQGWQLVDDLGVLDRAGVAAVLREAKVGLVTLFPTPNYVEALPIKLFEYMAAGLAVVASDFPVWRGIVDDAGCGLLVDPEDPAAIALALKQLFADPERARAMGAAGREAVQKKYSWAAESEKLVALYEKLEN